MNIAMVLAIICVAQIICFCIIIKAIGSAGKQYFEIWKKSFEQEVKILKQTESEQEHDIGILINEGERWTGDEIRAIKLKWQKKLADQAAYRRNLAGLSAQRQADWLNNQRPLEPK